ncbi:MAG: VCBS repeat-containing protein, partial [Balneolaceae bacterium]|nr:VCBS repeat-containing protein [Balneolaceae bacterium]
LSREACIVKEGHGLGVQIVDINQNGYKDIYVANDYISEDLFWINQGDGTFIDMASELFKHTSYSAMGTDIADLTNNGLPDIFTLDMLPVTNIRRKMMANPNNYRNYINDAFVGFHPQYTRNTLQLNRGSADETGLPIFSEVALLANVAATDWSWAALLADFDNDGFRDIYVTNGIPRDVTDKDFWDEYGRVRNIMPMRIAQPKIPEVKISNYLFRNSGEIVFEDVTQKWGLDFPTYSTGAVYVDLNNNGALDLIVNNTNHPAEIYRNHLMEIGDPSANNWLKVDLHGSDKNRNAIGAIIDLYFGGEYHQRHENTPYRGYLSSVDPVLHFGLGNHTVVDSLIITWPESGETKQTVLVDVESNQTLNVSIQGAIPVINDESRDQAPIFRDVTKEMGIAYRHKPGYVNDFHEQPTLPYKLSEIGPAIAVGDLSNNGLDDILIGATSVQNAVIFYQQEDGSFIKQEFSPLGELPFTLYNATDLLIFDANGNGLNDIYIVTGGAEFSSGDERYKDLFFQNDGKGKFTYMPDAVPDFRLSGSVVRKTDLTGNGLPDLFVGGRLNPGRYPESVSSKILINVSDESGIKFVDTTKEIAPELTNIGNINDAQWHDVTGNGHEDLMLAGDWMPITIFENNGNSLQNITSAAGTEKFTGWWNRILVSDISGNGLPDILAGNLGLNSLYKATQDEPVKVYFGDLTDDGFFEAIFSVYKSDFEGNSFEYPAHNREDYVRMMPGIMSGFPTHEEFGKATTQDLLNALPGEPHTKEARHFSSSIFYNRGEGNFEMVELPIEVQFSKVLGIHADDFTGNGFQDLLISGNRSGADLKVGSYNASNGLLLEGGEDGQLSEVPHQESGFYFPNFPVNLIPINTANNRTFYIIPQHNGEVRIIELDKSSHT